MNAYQVKAGMVFLQIKLRDPCVSALKLFAYHARCHTCALFFTFLHANLGVQNLSYRHKTTYD